MENKIVPIRADEVEDLKEYLEPYPKGTYEALESFRAEQKPEQLKTFLLKVLEYNVEEEVLPQLENPSPDLKINDDLGIDSLATLEIIMAVEECLPSLEIDNKEFTGIHTIGDLNEFLRSKLLG